MRSAKSVFLRVHGRRGRTMEGDEEIEGAKEGRLRSAIMIDGNLSV